jgi:hypothetical protein
MKKTATIEISNLINIQGEIGSIWASISYRKDIKQAFFCRISDPDTLIPKSIDWLKSNGFTHYKLNNKTISI